MIARTNLRGQIVTPDGIGGYAGVAATSFLFAEDDDEGSTELGDLELGALYQTRTSPTSTLGVRAGPADGDVRRRG
jgi:hypothetical protein